MRDSRPVRSRLPRLTLRTLMVAIVVAAGGLAVFRLARDPRVGAINAAVVMVVAEAWLAVGLGRLDRRAGRIGFALSASVYLALVIGPWCQHHDFPDHPLIPMTFWIEWVDAWLFPKSFIVYGFGAATFKRHYTNRTHIAIGHALITLALELIGAMVGRLLHAGFLTARHSPTDCRVVGTPEPTA